MRGKVEGSSTHRRRSVDTSIYTQFIQTDAVERILAEVGGILSVYLGYRLFLKGVVGNSDFAAGKGDITFKIANAAPGIFFELFGATILCVGLIKPPRLVAGQGDNPPGVNGIAVIPLTKK